VRGEENKRTRQKMERKTLFISVGTRLNRKAGGGANSVTKPERGEFGGGEKGKKVWTSELERARAG